MKYEVCEYEYCENCSKSSYDSNLIKRIYVRRCNNCYFSFLCDYCDTNYGMCQECYYEIINNCKRIANMVKNCKIVKYDE